MLSSLRLRGLVRKSALGPWTPFRNNFAPAFDVRRARVVSELIRSSRLAGAIQMNALFPHEYHFFIGGCEGGGRRRKRRADRQGQGIWNGVRRTGTEFDFMRIDRVHMMIPLTPS